MSVKQLVPLNKLLYCKPAGICKNLVPENELAHVNKFANVNKL